MTPSGRLRPKGALDNPYGDRRGITGDSPSLNDGSVFMLPKIFFPAGGYDLLRLGRNFDGGYIVEERSVTNAGILYSFGVGDDWAFEEDFLARNDVRLETYDHTVSQDILWRDAARKSRKICSLRRFFTALKKYRKFSEFFQGKRHHNCVAVGYDGPSSKGLESIIGDDKNIFLKIDIEGWEYRILDGIIAKSNNIEGLVIEFHDVDLHCERITGFIEKLPLYLCHIHANNAGFVDDRGDPLVLELSFTKYPPVSAETVELPNALDYPNLVNFDELVMRFGD